MVSPMNEMPRWEVRLRVRRRGDGTFEERIFRKDEITVGRVDGNDITLHQANCSRRHCALTVDDEGRVWARDAGSTNGIWLRKGGEIVRGDDLLEVGDAVYIGDCAIELVAPPERVEDAMAR
jgi:pSer/pThr/pTyr-binding forkhead associated (FHA) protein